MRRSASIWFLQSVLFAVCVSPPAFAQDQKWSAWSEFGGAYKTDDASRGSVTLFAPLMQGPRDLLFVDARGKLFEDSAKEGNLALAYRTMLTNGWNVGAWVGADVRGTALDNTFGQVSGGLEALSESFDVRLNGYGPISAPQAAGLNTSFTQVVLSGPSIYMIGGQEVGLRGVDGEVGVRLPTQMFNLDSEKIELRAYGGGFYFDHEAALKEVAGPKARLELRINDVIAGMPGSRITAEYAYSHDRVRDHRHEIGARLRVPLGAPQTWTRYAGLSAQERRMMDGLQRDVDIVVVQSEAEPVEDALTNVDFDRVAYVNNGGDINGTATAAGANSLIITKGGTISGEQFLQDSQTLQSGASTIQVRGLRSGTVANFTAPFSKTTLTNDTGNVVNLVSNTHLNGFVIHQTTVGSTNDAVVARDAGGNDGFRNFAITNNSITTVDEDSNAIGIDDGNDTVWVIGNTLSTIGEDAQGIEFGADNENVSLLNNKIRTEGYSADGIEIAFANRNFRISGNTIETHGEEGDGIYVIADNRNFDVADNTIETSGLSAYGMYFGGFNRGIAVGSNTVTTTGEAADGISFDGENSNVTVSGNTVSTSGDDSFAIAFYGLNSDIAVTENDVRTQGETADGVYFGFANDNIVVADNTITTREFDSFGITLDEANTNASVTGNTIVTEGAIAPGIYVGLGNSDVMITGNEVRTAGFFSNGIRLDFLNDAVSITGNTLVTTNDESDAVLVGFGNTAISVQSNDLMTSGSGADGIQVGGGNAATIAGNRAVGSIGDDYLDVIFGGNTIGGAGNTIAAGTVIGDAVCEAAGGSGSVEIGGIVYAIPSAACPP